MALFSIGLMIAPIRAQSAFDPVSIATFFAGIHSVINSVRDAANDVLENGNAIVSQNTLLISKQLEYVLGQAEAAYNRQLNDSVTKMDTTVHDRLVQLDAMLKSSIKKVGGETRETVLAAQAAANQLLNKLPFVNRDPHVIGTMNTPVLPGQKATDLEVIGFNLIDVRLNRKPSIIVEDLGTISDGDIAMISDAILGIRLGEAKRKQLGFGPTGCIDEQFKILVTVFQKGWLSTKSFPFECWVMPCARRTQVIGTITYAGVANPIRMKRTNEINIKTGYIDARVWNAGPQNRTRTLKMEIPDQAKNVSARSWWTKSGGKPRSIDAGSPVVGKGIVTAIGRITGDSTLYGKGVWATYHLRAEYEIETSKKPVPFVDDVNTVLGDSQSDHVLREDKGRIVAVSLKFVDENFQVERDVLTFNSPPPNQNFDATSKNALFSVTINRAGMHIQKK